MLRVAGLTDALPVEEPGRVVVLVIVPRSTPARLRVSDIIAAGNEVFESRTDLILVDAAQAGVDDTRLRACRGESRLLCWANELGTTSSRSEWLMVVAPLADAEDTVRMSALLLNATRARSVTDSDETVRLNRILEEATVHSPPVRVDLRDERALRRFCDEIYEERFARVLGTEGHTNRFAEVMLEAPIGSTVEIDGRVIGSTRQPTTRLTRIRPGSHRLAVVDPLTPNQRFETEVELNGGEHSRVTVRLDAPAVPRVSTLIVSGAFVALGIASTVFGATRSTAIDPCYDATCNDDGRRFDGFVPIGSGLIVGGAALVPSALIHDDETAWWLAAAAIVTGAAAGAVTTAIR